MNPLFRHIDNAVGMACRGVLYLTLTLVFVILSANVGLRYIAGTSLAFASELPELLFPWMIMAGVVLAAQHGSHIAVVILTQRMPPSVRRWVLAGGALGTAAMYIALACTAWPLAEIAADERTPILQVPGSVGVFCLMTGFVLLALVTLLRLPQIWACPAGDAPQPDEDAMAAPVTTAGAHP
ncbi:TRAP transporter small permease [Xylophilus sp. GOD-11R]|uniref:TRAP transporter small permease n=1 Tax=Xylophilus sp. GOD-11R TaxID=3089814 RepID=UPI00298CDBE8|nr:TRAP transporter small permease subunit [Xylophilus sp. GOD-11R]WPB57324.1 TRAP transporter small permease subunit [Xylophilus sp. GOD-11R]